MKKVLKFLFVVEVAFLIGCILSCNEIVQTAEKEIENIGNNWKEMAAYVDENEYMYEVVIDGNGTYRGIIPKTIDGNYVRYSYNITSYDLQEYLLASRVASWLKYHGYSKREIESALSCVSKLPNTNQITDNNLKDILVEKYNQGLRMSYFEEERSTDEMVYAYGENNYNGRLFIRRISRELINKQSMVNYELKREFPSLTVSHDGAMLIHII